MKTQRIFSKIGKYALITLAILLALGGIGIYMLPGLLQTKLVALIEESTGRKASIAKIDINLNPLQLGLHNFAMQELNGQPFASFADFTARINTSQSIAQSALVIDNIQLAKPNVQIVRQKDGEFNFKDLIKPSTDKQEESTAVFPVTIDKLAITEGKLTWKDGYLPKPDQETISPINLEISHFSTQSKTPADLTFGLAISSGSKLEWKAKLGISPIASSGHINLDKIQFERIKTLALHDLPFDLKGYGVIDLDYDFSQADKDLKLTVKQSKIELHDVQWTDASANNMQAKIPVVTLSSGYELTIGKELNLAINQSKLAIKDVQFSAPDQGDMQVAIPAINLDGDYGLKQAEKNLTLAINNSKLALQDVKFSTTQPGKIQVLAPAINLEAKYQIISAENDLDVTANSGNFSIKNIQLLEQGHNDALVKIPNFALQGLDFNLKKQQLNITNLSADNAEIKSWLDAQGLINYQSLFPADKTPASTSAQTASKPEPTSPNPWTVQINNAAFNNFGLSFEDRSFKKPVTMTAKPINIKLTNVSTKAGAKLPFQVSIGINQNGSIKLTGDSVISPLSAKVAVAIKGIDLEKFQPYVDKFARLDIIDGSFNADGNLSLANNAKDQLDIKFKGNSGIAELLTRDQIKNKDLVKWENLTLKDIDADVLANKYTAAALVINKPYARVIINKDKTINFKDIQIPEKNNAAKPVKTAAKAPANNPASPKIQFHLAKVQIIDGSSDFADLSLILPFAAQIKSLDGGASGISSEQKSSIKVDLKGNAYDLAPVTISGDISPYLGDYNIALNFDGMPMPLISSYMVQFAGYKVEKGKMTLGLNYKVAKGQLTASNSILIDQFELGEKVENPDAVSLPLELAVSLMKDSDGKIKIDVPISGSLEDPQFSITHIITDALFNVITKVVTSPFRAIGSLIGSDEDLSTVEFAAGSAKLDKQQASKLQGLAKALKEKPDLNLDIKGTAFQEQDWPELSNDALYDQLKRLRAAEINKEGGRKIRPENVDLSKDDYTRLLADLFIQKFPLMAEKSLLGKPKLVNPEAGDFYEIAKQKLSEIIQPEKQRLKDLAAERAKAIAKFMVQKGSVPNERIYILDTAIDPERKNKDIASVLSLKTN